MEQQMERKPRVILFEDDKSIRKMLELALKENGCDTFTYEDPSLCPLQYSHDCQCSANETCADIVITDIDMPKVSGLDFIEDQLRKGCNVSNVAIMSGSWSNENRKRASTLGCEVFFKPFSLLHLKEWIDKCLENNIQTKDLSNWFLMENNT